MSHPSYLGWQVDWPLFVKMPFTAAGKNYKQGDAFDWLNLDVARERVAILYASGYVYHNSDLEVKTKVGDRLNEMTQEQLTSLVLLLNARVKELSTSGKEFNEKRCKQSRITDKQKGLIRRFLNANDWIKEDFYKYRDQILG